MEILKEESSLTCTQSTNPFNNSDRSIGKAIACSYCSHDWTGQARPLLQITALTISSRSVTYGMHFENLINHHPSCAAW